MTKRKNLIVISVAIMITVLAVIIGYSVRKISMVDTSKLAEQNDGSKIEIPEQESKLNTIKTQEINEANLLDSDISVVEAFVLVEDIFGYQKIGDNLYLKKGDTIRIGVKFNKDVYDQNRK